MFPNEVLRWERKQIQSHVDSREAEILRLPRLQNFEVGKETARGKLWFSHYNPHHPPLVEEK